MEPEKTINPELVKKCAEMIGAQIDLEDFDILNIEDREALQMALERDGWIFFALIEQKSVRSYAAARDILDITTPGRWAIAESPALRCLACVSVMTGVPLYV
jgi:hypothetical protein